MAAWADCDSLGRRARQGCFVAVLGEVTADAALTFRRRGVEGFFRRVVHPEGDKAIVSVSQVLLIGGASGIPDW